MGSNREMPSWLKFAGQLLLIFLLGGLALHIGRMISLVLAAPVVALPRPLALLAFYGFGLLAQPVLWLDELPGWGVRPKRRSLSSGWKSWVFVVPAFCFLIAMGFAGISNISRVAQYRYAVEAAPGWDVLSSVGIWFVFLAMLGVGFAVEILLRRLAKCGGKVASRRRAAIIVGMNVVGLLLAAAIAMLV